MCYCERNLYSVACFIAKRMWPLMGASGIKRRGDSALRSCARSRAVTVEMDKHSRFIKYCLCLLRFISNLIPLFPHDTNAAEDKENT